MGKSLIIAYFLYFTFGWIGLHLLYLQRNEQAVLWSWSGGLFGLGLFRDFFRIPHYVRLANRDHLTLELIKTEVRESTASISWSIRLASIFISFWFGSLFASSFALFVNDDDDDLSHVDTKSYLIYGLLTFHNFYRTLSILLRSFGYTFGVVLTMRASTLYRVPFVKTFISTFLVHVIIVIYYSFYDQSEENESYRNSVKINKDSSFAAILAAIIMASSNVKWNLNFSQSQQKNNSFTYTLARSKLVNDNRNGSNPLSSKIKKPNTSYAQADNNNNIDVSKNMNNPDLSPDWSPSAYEGNACRRSFLFLLLFALFSFLFISNLSTNIQIDNVPLHRVIQNARRSPEYQEFINNLHLIWNAIRERGWEDVWNEVRGKLDVDGSKNALAVLQLDQQTFDSITLLELKRLRNKLALKYHPDKCNNNIESGLSVSECHEKFQSIQEAFETLEKIKNKQNKQNPPTAEKKTTPTSSSSATNKHSSKTKYKTSPRTGQTSD